MSTASLSQALEGLLRQFLAQNPAYRPLIADVADQLSKLAREEPAVPESQPSASSRTAEPPQVAVPPRPTIPAHGPERATQPPLATGFVPLKLADAVVTHVRVAGTGADLAAARHSVVDAPAPREPDAELRRYQPPDLELIRTRCLLKAQACRAAIARRAAPPDDEPQHFRVIGGLIAQGKQLDNCYLWMVNRSKPQPDDLSLERIAAAYENLASAATVCERVPRDARSDRRTVALSLLAEAQSALRVALEDTWLTVPDRDQDDAFRYLDESTSYEQVFIARHMKLSDPADPSAWRDLQGRLEEFARGIGKDEESLRQFRGLLARARHHARHILANPGSDATHDWTRIDEAIRELVRAGRGRDAELADVLRSVAHVAPPARAFPAVDDALALLGDLRESEETPDSDRYSDAVARVTTLLGGGRIVIVGGERRDDAVRRIRDAFDLEAVDWISLTEHGSTSPAEAPIRRPQTKAVFVLIRLVGHLHAEEVAQYCERHDKPLVRLPAGYNPERMAAEVIEQISQRLQAG